MPPSRFSLHDELGRGGMGRVVLAQDRELGRDVAIKFLLDPSSAAPHLIARFVAEARITGQLEHPNIVPVHDLGTTPEGEPYFVMKRVQGRSLHDVLVLLAAGDRDTARHWTRHRLLSAFVQLGQAVAYAHDRGILHRDLKPGNVMLGRFGEVLVMDWGLAQAITPDVGALPSTTSGPTYPTQGGPELGFADTIDVPAVDGNGIQVPHPPTRVLADSPTVAQDPSHDGGTIGTPGYMSPEQAQGDHDRVDVRSDVYSLGAILYEMLSLQRAHPGADVYTLLFQTVSGPPVDPRLRAPEQRIPAEVAGICMRALVTDPAGRFPSAAALVAAVEAFLEGSRRREAAQIHVAAAREAWARFQACERERETLRERERTLSAAVPPWAPLVEKVDLLGARDRLSRLGPLSVRAFAELQAACEHALSQDPENRDAHSLLALAHWERFTQADAAHDADGLLYHAERVRAHDDGTWEAAIQGDGAMTLLTDPPGATVICERFVTEGLVWTTTDRRVLGKTPIVTLPMSMGSYRITLQLRGRRDTIYPIDITRGRHWDAGAHPIPLLTDAEIGPDSVYVPAGPFLCGGDPDAPETGPRRDLWEPGFVCEVLPVTMEGYCRFVNALHACDPEAAWRRAPRAESTDEKGGGSYWERPPPGQTWIVPKRDRDGDPWDPRWPAGSVSWHDAVAFAAWRAEAEGLPWRLPSETQWEKAARGVDGRLYPWGDAFDPTLCKMRDSRPGRSMLEPVGAFPADVSVYGVRDMAGGNRDWCGEDHFSGETSRRPVRGGSWYSSARLCRVTNRVGNEPWAVLSNYGFRVVLAVGNR